MIKYFLIIIITITGFFYQLSYAQNKHSYIILISFSGFRYDFDNGDRLRNFNYMRDHGVKAQTLKPVFPTTSLTNQYSAATGLYAENHGIIANSFRDPFTDTYYSINYKASLKEERWYSGEPIWLTAKRNGIKTGAYFWAGSDLDDEYRKPSYSVEFDEELNNLERIDKGIEELQRDGDDKPSILMFNFDEIAQTCYRFGTESIELVYSLSIADSILGYLFYRLKEIELFDSANIIVMSEHGISDIETGNKINIDSILENLEYEIQNYGSYMMIEPGESESDEIYDRLKTNQQRFRVYHKNSKPEYFHYSEHPYISSILLIAEPGWILTDNISDARTDMIKAVNGYDNNELEMHGIFYAMGPAFKTNLQTSTLRIIDIYPLLCEIMNISAVKNIDGKAERINFILKDK